MSAEKRDRAWACVAAGLALAGCARPSSVRGPQVRPAALVRAQAKADTGGADVAERFKPFRLPFALATPEDAIVRVVSKKASCTGTLIDVDLVLTAQHCIVRRNEAGDFTPTRMGADELSIELGGGDLAWGDVGVKAIVAAPCGHTGGGGDVAVLVLERKLVGVQTLPTRLDQPPHAVPESVTANAGGRKLVPIVDPVGFGRCTTSVGGVHRRARSGGPIEAVAKGTFRVHAAVCPGDSGGPVLVRGTNEVVGVMSMSAMDADERSAGTSIAARIDAVRPVFAQARAIADGASAAELPPLVCPDR